MNPSLANEIRHLERAISDAARVWVGDIYCKSPFDSVPIPCAVYEGHVPLVQAGDMGSVPKAPSVAVRIQSATWHREYGEVHVNFAILTWDDDLLRMGYRDVENIGWRLNQGVYEYRGIPLVKKYEDGSFSMTDANVFQLTDHPTSFELIEDPSVDFFPYFLGVYTAVFGVPTPEPNRAPWNQIVNPSLTVSSPGAPEAVPHKSVI